MENVVLVPCCDCDLKGYGVAVRDARSRKPVWFKATELTLAGDVLCVRAEVVEAADRFRLVTLPGLGSVWVDHVLPA